MNLQSLKIEAFLRKFVVVALPLWMIYMAFFPAKPPAGKEVLLTNLSKSITNGEITIQASYEKQGAAYAKIVSKKEFMELLRRAVHIESSNRINSYAGTVARVELDAGNSHLSVDVSEDLGRTGLYLNLSFSGEFHGDVRLHLLDATPMKKLLVEP